MILSFQNNTPDVKKAAFIAPSADIIGSVELGKDSSVWYGCVLRGDYNNICVGNRTNIQDLSVIHINSPKKNPDIPGDAAVIGDDVTIGHKVIIHACTIENACLIGMGACILDKAVIGKESIVGAGSLVTKGKSFPPRSLILGSPAKVVRQLSDDEVNAIYRSAENYVKYAKEHSKYINS